MIMILELKHIAPYLPYGLKAVKGVTRIEITSISLELPHVYHTSYLGSRLRVVSNIQDIKPILRPLSDLTKEIEINGEKLIPYDWFDDHEETNYFEDSMWVKYLFEYEKGYIIDLDLIPYGVICKLLEWNFDIFGLIEKDLAIDINAL